MSSIPAQLMVVGCPHCGTQLQVPAAMGGRQGQCLRCQGVVDIPHAATLAQPSQSQFASAPLPSTARGPAQQVASQPAAPSLPFDADEYSLAAPEPTLPALDPANYAPRSYPKSDSGGGAFSLEKSGLDAGILGGIGLMVLSVVWFFGALFFFDVIFFYPPILFIIGLVAMIRGLINSVSNS